METLSLKALANKVLYGNINGNQAETKTKDGGNFLETSPPKVSSKVSSEKARLNREYFKAGELPAKIQVKNHRSYKRYPQGSFLESFVEMNDDDKEMKIPFIGSSGLLIIPFDCEKKYRWWELAGQGLEKTYQEAKRNEQ